MASQSHVKPKDRYDDLADTQKAIVDAKVNHPEWNNVEIADHVDTNRSYVSQVLNTQGHIVAERVGGLPEARQWQGIKDRPENDGDGFEPVITFNLTHTECRSLLRGEVADELYNDLLDELIHRAFHG